MDRTLFESASAERRLEAARALVRRAYETSARVTLVAPSREAGRDLVRAIAIERGASSRVAPTTLTELALALARPSLVRRGETWLAGSGFDAVVAHAMRALPSLGRYEPVREMPGTPHAIGRTLDELALADLGPDALLAVDPDLARIASGVVGELERRRLVSTATLLARATAALHERPTAAAELGTLILLDVPLRHALEGELVRALVQKAERALVTLPRGDLRSRAFLGSQIGLAEEHDARVTSLARSLFGAREPREGPAAPRAVVVRSGTTEAEECVELARAILDAIEAPARTPLDRIAIVLREPERYRVPLTEALSRAGIPFHLEQGARRPDPSGRAFLALLDCAASHLSARAFAEYLAFGVLPQTDASGAPSPATERGEAPERDADALTKDEENEDADERTKKRSVVGGALRAPRRWERLLVDASVIGGGPERWRRRLDGLLHELEGGLSEEADPDGPEARRLHARKVDLERLRSFALPLIERLDAMPRRSRWSEMLSALESLARASLAEPRRVLEVLAQLAPLVSDGSTRDGDQGEIELADVRRALLPRLREITPTPIDRGGAVRVLSADTLAGRAFELVLVPGLVERAFPRRLVEDPILPDRARHALDEARPDDGEAAPPPLATAAERADEERLLLARIAQSAPRLVCSFPRRDERNRARVPSLFLLELVRADRGELVSALALAKESVSSELAPGWPAPRDPRLAIDQREADLATIASLLSQEPEASRGRAAYLLTESAALGRALRARGRRHLPKWNVQDGLVTDDAHVLEALAKERPGARVFSATALESFASCPYRFHLKTIVRLRGRETAEALEELDPMTRGSLIHAMQYRVVRAAKEAGLEVHRDRDALLASLDAAIDGIARDAEDRLAPAIPAVFASEIEAIRRDLQGWLHRLSEDAVWSPALAELGFGEPGGDDHDPASVAAPVEVTVPLPGDVSPAGSLTLRLRGSIDLVEARQGALRATDHKSGKARTKSGAVIAGGESLQPLLYALVLEAMLARGLLPFAAGTEVEGGRLSYCTEKGGYQSVSVALDARGRAAVGLVGAAVDRAIESAFLPRHPKPGACDYCDYVPICGPRAAELAGRKDEDPRGALLARVRGER